MSRPPGYKKSGMKKKAKKPKRPVVLLFAENPHDSTAMKSLIAHANPSFSSVADVAVMRDPPSLTRTASEGPRKNWLEKVAAIAAARNTLQPVRAVLVHQDSDGPDHDGTVEQNLRGALATHVPDVTTHPVVPVQMTEAWWLLFPDAIRAVRPEAWRKATFPVGDTATITDPKKTLITATKKVTPKHPYREADSLTIAEEIRKRALDPVGTNRSWDRFLALARAL